MIRGQGVSYDLERFGNNLHKPRAFGRKQGGIKLKFELTEKEPITENENPIEWVRWYESTNNGEKFTIHTSSISFKDEGQPVFYLIDEAENIGTSVYAAHHPNAKFTDATPHGIRLANAIGRAFGIEGSVEASDLVEAVNAEKKPVIVSVVKTEKGVLWTVLRA